MPQTKMAYDLLGRNALTEFFSQLLGRKEGYTIHKTSARKISGMGKIILLMIMMFEALLGVL